MKTIGATDFKTHCLTLLDEVAEGGEVILILKRGRPVARLVPVVEAGASAQASLLGTMHAMDDLVDPPLPPDAWEAAQEP